MKFFLIIASSLFFYGCSHTQGEVYTETKVYSNTKSHDILNAVKRVFRADENNTFTIDTYRYELNATNERAMNSHFVGIDLYTEFYNFKVLDENETSVTIELQVGINHDSNQTRYENIGKDNMVYSILWNRIDYILNKTEELDGCRSFDSIDSLYSIWLDTVFLCTIDKDKLRKE